MRERNLNTSGVSTPRVGGRGGELPRRNNLGGSSRKCNCDPSPSDIPFHRQIERTAICQCVYIHSLLVTWLLSCRNHLRVCASWNFRSATGHAAIVQARLDRQLNRYVDHKKEDGYRAEKRKGHKRKIWLTVLFLLLLELEFVIIIVHFARLCPIKETAIASLPPTLSVIANCDSFLRIPVAPIVQGLRFLGSTKVSFPPSPPFPLLRLAAKESIDFASDRRNIRLICLYGVSRFARVPWLMPNTYERVHRVCRYSEYASRFACDVLSTPRPIALCSLIIRKWRGMSHKNPKRERESKETPLKSREKINRD